MNPRKFVNCRSMISNNQHNHNNIQQIPRRIKSTVDEKNRTPKFTTNPFTSHFSKITEKDCTDLQSLVKKSVDDINDLFSLKELQSSFNAGLDTSRRKNQSVSLSKEIKRNLNTEISSLKETIAKEAKPNFTFNINNYINVPHHSKARSITRYVDDEDSFDFNHINNNLINSSQKTDRILPQNKTINVNQLTVSGGRKKQHVFQNYVNVTKKGKMISGNSSSNQSLTNNKKTINIDKEKNEMCNSSKSLKTPTSASNNNNNSNICTTTNNNMIKVQKARSISISCSHQQTMNTNTNTNPNVTIASPMNSHSNFLHKNQNYHTIINKIYSKEFPHNNTKTNDILKLMLFLNEYLINNNLLKDYYLPANKKILNDYSKYLSSNISIDYPEQSDIDHSKLDKVVNSTKIIQRAWRKAKIKKFIGKKNNINHELKKMVLNDYITRAGFKAKRILGLFNSTVESFVLLCNDNDANETLNTITKIIKGTNTECEKNILYKEYINKIILCKI